MRARDAVRWTGALVVTVVVTACGAPGSVRPSAIDPTEVPYDLLAGPADPLSSSMESADVPREQATTPVYLLAPDGTGLEATATAIDPGASEQVADQALQLLESPPTGAEREEGLGTTLGPAVDLTLVRITDGVAEVQVRLVAGELAADQVPLALGQVVLTLTAVPGIRAVQLVGDERQPVEMALPGGVLTTDPVTAADYSRLVVAPDR